MELGAGYKSAQEEQPVSTVGLSNIAQLAVGYHFTVARLGDGTVRTWGGNAFGQLGDHTHQLKGVPYNVGVTGVTQISAGGAHVLALHSNGTISNWGDNEYGELGNGLLNPMKRINKLGQLEATMQGSGRNEPVPIPNVQGAVAVATGNGDEFALLSNGTVLAWGKNDKSQLGSGRSGPQVCKTEVGPVPCDTKPELVLLPDHEPLHGVKSIAAGGATTYALLTSGKVMAWGSNGRGELGNGTAIDSNVAIEVKGLAGVVSIDGGWPFALALRSDGRVLGWGGNSEGELGLQANETCQKEPCVKTPRLIPGLENVSQISAGRALTLALSAGRLYALGDNEPWGQLGIGGTLSTTVPRAIEGLPTVTTMAAGEQHGIAALANGDGPSPLFSVTASGGLLHASWTVNAPVSGLRWRMVNFYTEWAPWSRMVYFRQTCSVKAPCTYTLPSLPAVPVEVELLNYVSNRVVMNRKTIVTP
jgi:alpha-tubulin suppressor-like RCC1 family protein